MRQRVVGRQLDRLAILRLRRRVTLGIGDQSQRGMRFAQRRIELERAYLIALWLPVVASAPCAAEGSVPSRRARLGWSARLVARRQEEGEVTEVRLSVLPASRPRVEPAPLAFAG